MTAAIFGLWRNWAVAVGLLMMLAVCAPVVPRQYLAPLNVVFFLALQWLHAVMRRSDVPSCSRLIQEVSAVILIAALFVVGVYFFARGEDMVELNGQPFDMDSPVIEMLVVAPVTTVVTLLFMLRRRSEPLVCQKCKLRYGNVIEHGFIGELFSREWRYQTSLLFTLSLLLTVVDWGYYLTNYVNISLNKADLFFFVWMPLTIYALSLVYLGLRYYSLWIYYCHNDEEHLVSTPGSSTLRFLLIHDDCLFVDMMSDTSHTFANGAKIKRFDTPAIVHTDYCEHENLHNAIRLFQEYTGIRGAEIRLIYSSPDEITFRNVYHYFAFINDEEEMLDSKIEGEWLKWGHLRQLAQQGILSPDLVTELTRVWRIAMAWKTYDEGGRRLYPIKNYKPTFRLRDIRSWDVNYDDTHWLTVDRTNQDKFWYPVKRLFNKRMRAHG